MLLTIVSIIAAICFIGFHLAEALDSISGLQKRIAELEEQVATANHLIERNRESIEGAYRIFSLHSDVLVSYDDFLAGKIK